jgi:putative toxin-antitoxin system antitoxin component (TIGR02293 family)
MIDVRATKFSATFRKNAHQLDAMLASYEWRSAMITQAEKEAGQIEVTGPHVRNYRPSLDPAEESIDRPLFGLIPKSILTDRVRFIEATRKGIPGTWVKGAVAGTGLRPIFLKILNVSSGNLSRIYQKKALDRDTSEEVLDTVRFFCQAVEVWESSDLALEWFQSPVPALGGEKPCDLLDTFEGRRWIAQVLNKIEYGDFS